MSPNIWTPCLLNSGSLELNFLPVAEYFEVTYVRGRPARGRRARVPVRFAPALWNQLQAVIEGLARTNNASKGWHNRFQVLVGKKHPSLYAFLGSLQNEQGDTETIARQIDLGQRVRDKWTGNFQAMEGRILNIVSKYQEHAEQGTAIEYLKAIGHHIPL
ncbi:hypothetical protein TKK_0013532 [Trichogramma kaykai]